VVPHGARRGADTRRRGNPGVFGDRPLGRRRDLTLGDCAVVDAHLIDQHLLGELAGAVEGEGATELPGVRAGDIGEGAVIALTRGIVRLGAAYAL